MSYEPTIWRSGDLISAERLNNIEDGIAQLDDVVVFTTTATYDENNDTYSFSNVSYADVTTALTANKIPMLIVYEPRSLNEFVYDICFMTSSYPDYRWNWDYYNENLYLLSDNTLSTYIPAGGEPE